MKYLSTGSRSLIAAGVAVLACISPTALYAQSGQSYQTVTQGNGAYGSTQIVRPGGTGQPVSPPTAVMVHPTNPMPGPVQFVGPPFMRTGGLGFGPQTWNGPGYGPTVYSGPAYGRSPYGPVTYQPHPTYGQPTGTQMPVREQIVIPDPVASPTGQRSSPPRMPVIPTVQQGVLGSTRPHYQIVAPGGEPIPTPARTVYAYNPPAQHFSGDGRDRHGNHEPAFLGGYYFSNYCDDSLGSGSYLSAYSLYPGFPEYIFEPDGSVVVFSPPVVSPYVGAYIPFDASGYGNYGMENSYGYSDQNNSAPVTPSPNAQPSTPPSEGQQTPQPPVNQEQPSEKPTAPLYPAGSYKEAFADIESAWINGDIDSIRKHLRDNDLKIAVSLNGKYSYSIASGDWADITRDALDHLQSVSFEFTLLRFQKNGDITGYAKQVYTADSKDGDKQNTMYLSYTLRHRNNAWYIVEVDTSAKPLIKEQKDQPAASTDHSATTKPVKDSSDSRK